jgi:hypothetical protein
LVELAVEMSLHGPVGFGLGLGGGVGGGVTAGKTTRTVGLLFCATSVKNVSQVSVTVASEIPLRVKSTGTALWKATGTLRVMRLLLVTPPNVRVQLLPLILVTFTLFKVLTLSLAVHTEDLTPRSGCAQASVKTGDGNGLGDKLGEGLGPGVTDGLGDGVGDGDGDGLGTGVNVELGFGLGVGGGAAMNVTRTTGLILPSVSVNEVSHTSLPVVLVSL